MKILALLLLLATACEPGWMKKCRENGGYVERFNCRDIPEFKCDYYTDSQGRMQLSGCYTNYYTVCDYRCVGASTESSTGASK